MKTYKPNEVPKNSRAYYGLGLDAYLDPEFDTVLVNEINDMCCDYALKLKSGTYIIFREGKNSILTKRLKSLNRVIAYMNTPISKISTLCKY